MRSLARTVLAFAVFGALFGLFCLLFGEGIFLIFNGKAIYGVMALGLTLIWAILAYRGQRDSFGI